MRKLTITEGAAITAAISLSAIAWKAYQPSYLVICADAASRYGEVTNYLYSTKNEVERGSYFRKTAKKLGIYIPEWHDKESRMESSNTRLRRSIDQFCGVIRGNKD